MDVDGGEGLMNKKPRDSNTGSMATTVSSCEGHDMNFPLPGERGVSAIVKVSHLLT